MRRLNGCNSQMLARITGRDVQTEARSATSSFDLIKNIRTRRLKWLGQILRGDQTRILFKAIEQQHVAQDPGNLFMDTPNHVSLEDMIVLAKDKTYWKSLEARIPSHIRGDTIYTT